MLQVPAQSADFKADPHLREGGVQTKRIDPQSSGGANYALEVWDDKPHQVAPMSGIALTVIGVVNQSGGVPALRKLRQRRRWLPLPHGERRAPNLRRDSAPEGVAKSPLHHSILPPTLGGSSRGLAWRAFCFEPNARFHRD